MNQFFASGGQSKLYLKEKYWTTTEQILDFD